MSWPSAGRRSSRAAPTASPASRPPTTARSREYRSLDAGGPLTVAALKNGDVQAADLFTTDGSIPANDFVVLEDHKNNFAAQNVVPADQQGEGERPRSRQVLNGISAKLTTENLTALNAEAASDAKPSLDTVAKGWLTQNGLG